MPLSPGPLSHPSFAVVSPSCLSLCRVLSFTKDFSDTPVCDRVLHFSSCRKHTSCTHPPLTAAFVFHSSSGIPCSSAVSAQAAPTRDRSLPGKQLFCDDLVPPSGLSDGWRKKLCFDDVFPSSHMKGPDIASTLSSCSLSSIKPFHSGSLLIARSSGRQRPTSETSFNPRGLGIYLSSEFTSCDVSYCEFTARIPIPPRFVGSFTLVQVSSGRDRQLLADSSLLTPVGQPEVSFSVRIHHFRIKVKDSRN